MLLLLYFLQFLFIYVICRHRFCLPKQSPSIDIIFTGTMTPLGKDGEILEFNNSSLFKLDYDLSCTTMVKKVQYCIYDYYVQL